MKEIATEKSTSKNEKNFKILVINEADKLTKEAQGALRRTMEKYIMRCRMILMCDNLHKLIMPIRSRCINIRVPAPSKSELYSILTTIAHDQGLKYDDEVINKIIKSSRRNLRDAICQLESFKCSKNP